MEVTVHVAYILESCRRADVRPHLTCNAATYSFRDIRGQNLGFLGPFGVAREV